MDNTEETVTISKKEYEELKDIESRYDALRAYGVDNWQGWDDAMQYYYEELKKKDEPKS